MTDYQTLREHIENYILGSPLRNALESIADELDDLRSEVRKLRDRVEELEDILDEEGIDI